MSFDKTKIQINPTMRSRIFTRSIRSNIMLYLVECVQNLLSFTIIAVNIYDIAKVNLIRSINNNNNKNKSWTKVEEFTSFAIKK